MNTQRGAFPSSLLVLWLAHAASAHGSPIEYDYSGIINSAAPGSGVTVGSPFSGTFTYDPSSQAPPAISIEGSNQYIYGQSVNFPNSTPDSSGLTFKVGDQTLYSHQGGLQVAIEEIEHQGQYGYGKSPSTLVGISNGNVDGNPLLTSIELSNPNQSVFHSLAPPPALTLADFPDAKLVVAGNGGTPQAGQTFYEGTITALSANLNPHRVPEPACMGLICIAAAGWLARARRR